MIALATQEFPVSQYPNLFFRQADASELSFRQEFDIVFSNAALHWVIDHRPVLRGIHNALKPNGKAIVQMVEAVGIEPTSKNHQTCCHSQD